MNKAADVRFCSVEDCETVAVCRGWCDKHYRRWLHNGKLDTLSPRDYFEAKVVRGPGCWRWTGAVDSDGYGNMRTRGRTVGAHRVSYELEQQW